jgi:hypothetical protein
MKNSILSIALLASIIAPSSVAFAEKNGSSMEDSKDKMEQVREEKSSNFTELTPVQISCVKSAITKREDALVLGRTAYMTAVTNAYAVRKNAILAAWDKTTVQERRMAVRAADKSFKDSSKSARSTWETSRKSAWSVFGTEKKNCGVSGKSSETGESKNDTFI